MKLVMKILRVGESNPLMLMQLARDYRATLRPLSGNEVSISVPDDVVEGFFEALGSQSTGWELQPQHESPMPFTHAARTHVDERFPDQPVVIDELAYTLLRDRIIADWQLERRQARLQAKINALQGERQQIYERISRVVEVTPYDRRRDEPQAAD